MKSTSKHSTTIQSNGQMATKLVVQGLHEWRGHTTEGVPWTVNRGDALNVLRGLPENCFDCVVTSPPYYWQRDYEVDGQIGKEATIEGYVQAVSAVMDGVRRVMKTDGLLFLNLGD